MLQGIIDGIVDTIRKEFGGESTIYLETLKQGLQKPCFFILPTETTQNRIRGNRLSYETHFRVIYLPEKEDGLEECYAVGERLAFALDLLHLKDGALRGRKQSFAVESGMLHFSVQYTYQFFAVTKDDTEMMEAFQIEFGVNE